MAIEFSFPFRVRPDGRVATSSYDRHVREMIEELLFTAPGERVNRPDFGCGLLELVFATDSDAVAAATQFLVIGALQRWLGDKIEVHGVTVESEENVLAITIDYTIRRTRVRTRGRFIR